MKITGIVTSIIYRNDENGYNIIVVETPDSDITCVGTMPFFNKDDKVEVTGELIYHQKYGEQINVSSIRLLKPSGKQEIVNFLANSNIKGIGKKTAELIYDKFKEKSLDIVYNDPDKLKVIEGIGDKKIDDIKKTTEESRDSRESMFYLQSLNISYKLAMKIYKTYGEDCIDIIKSNPYKLVDDIRGVGFAMADRIARNMQIESNSKFRISAGISHTLNYEADFNGHTSLKKDYLVKKVSQLLRISTNEVLEIIKEDSLTGKIDIVIIDGQEFVYKNSLFRAEKSVALDLSFKKDSEYIFDVVVDEDLQAFSKEQVEAINQAFKNMLLVITGGPGTGKTTIIRAITNILNKNELTYALIAPTGRAAKRISESTNDEAFTIHRLLGIKPDENMAEFNQENFLDKDYIIVDEVSMVDIYLMKSLLDAIGPSTALILVGDSDQLPSVGPGNVLKDIINTNIKTIRLKKIFRQGLESNIIVNAHRINNGLYPIVNEEGKDFFFIEANRNNFSQNLADLVKNRLAEFYKLDRLKDIQILSPSKKTQWGSQAINEYLQGILNPSNKEIKINDRILRLGDKVMQIRNNYELRPINGFPEIEGVYNGDIGFITRLNEDEEELEVTFTDGSIVLYKREDLKDLELSYAITIHKSQGSEFPCIIIPMMQVAPMLLNRNLLYTGITRAKKLVVLLGEKRILKNMVDNNFTSKRYTNLSYWINEMDGVIGD